VRRANLSRTEQSDLNRITKLAKVSPNPLGSSDFVSPGREHAGDILDDDEPGPRLDDDAACGRPEVAGVERAAPAAGHAVRLARDAANEAIHEAAPWVAVEGSGIRPDSCRSQETLFNRCDQVRDGEGFPLHHNDAASAGQSQLDAEIEPGAAGAEADEVEASPKAVGIFAGAWAGKVGR
jgi:hypothetical protein